MMEITFDPYVQNTYTEAFLMNIKSKLADKIEEKAKSEDNHTYYYDIRENRIKMSGYDYDEIKSITINDISTSFIITFGFVSEINYTAKVRNTNMTLFTKIQGKIEDYYKEDL